MNRHLYKVTMLSLALVISPCTYSKQIKILPLQHKVIKLSNQVDINSNILLAENETFTTELSDGYQTITKDNRLSLNNQFMIGSLSKQFTATALLIALKERNAKLTDSEQLKTNIQQALERPITSYLPKAHAIWQGNMPEWAKQVTLHQMLTHSSGIPDYTNQADFSTSQDEHSPFYAQPHRPYQIIDLIKDKPLLFEPGSQFSYSNTNYLLLAEIIETLSQSSYTDYLQSKVFTPLNMQATFAAESGNNTQLREVHPNLVRSMSYDPEQDNAEYVEPTWLMDLSNAKGSGSIISSLRDLEKWNTALHTSDKILPRSLYELMTTPHLGGASEGYGLGIEQGKYGIIYGYQGHIDDFNAAMLYVPQQKITIIVLSNLAHKTTDASSKTTQLKGYDALWSLLSDNLD